MAGETGLMIEKRQQYTDKLAAVGDLGKDPIGTLRRGIGRESGKCG
jgi:hypothetical protein